MTADRIIIITDTFYNEVCNGGFLQYFVNADGRQLSHIVESLREIGADDAANLFVSAIASFPCALPNKRSARNKFLKDHLTLEIHEHLEKCDAKFNALSNDLENLIGQYIDRHTSNERLLASSKDGQKDYYELIIKYITCTYTSFDDLSDAKLRRKSNKAMDEVHKLKKELYATSDKGQPIIQRLLQHNDPRAKITAGAYCIMAEIMIDEGRSILHQVASDDLVSKALRFEAECCLKYCRPYNTK